MEIGLYVASAVLGVLYRYDLGMINARKVVGVALSDGGSDTGFQDAITPPESTNHTIVLWITIVGVLAFSVYQFGWGTFGIAFVILFGVVIIAGATVMPKPESKHYVLRIYRSMINRYADFEKNGDTVRAAALKELIDRMESRYALIIAS